jgi:hypothetical protein
VAPVVDAVLHSIAGVLLLGAVGTERVDPFIGILGLLALLISHRGWSQIAEAIAQGGRQSESPQISSIWIRAMPALFARMYALLAVFAILSTTQARLLLELGLAFLLLTWPLAAPVAVVRGEFLRPPWLLVHVAAIRGLRMRNILVVLASGAIGILIGYALISLGAELGGVGIDPPAWVWWSLYAIVIAASILYSLVYAAKTIGHDWLWYIRWRRSPTRELTPNELLDGIGEQRTTSGITRFISDVRAERLLEPGAESERVLRDLLRVSRQAQDEKSMTVAYESENVRRWLGQNTDKKTLRIASAGVELRDELGPLIE